MTEAITVVTGGNRGIGREIALAFATRGDAVAICGRHEAALEETSGELEQLGANYLAARCDVSNVDSVESFGAAVLKRLGTPTTVIACSGIAGPTKPSHEIDPAEWAECIAVDLTGVFLTFRRFVPAMIERGNGNLIAIGSMTGKRPLWGRTPYAAAKMGVIGLVRALALELGPHGIRVNTVCPGAVAGPRIKRVIEAQAETLGVSYEDARRAWLDPTPLRRFVEPAEVAASCLFLTSQAGAGITGEDLNVTAGLVMY